MDDGILPRDDVASAAGSYGLPRALRELASLSDIDIVLQRMVDLSTDVVEGCTLADVMFIRDGGAITAASTDPLARELDDLQAQNGGPCMEAAQGRTVVVADDLAADERWPSFGVQAVDLGVRSVLSFQLFLVRSADDRFGALNLYGAKPDAFDTTAVHLGELLAAHCATVLAAAVAREGAQAALASRDLIGQAKGILMASERISAADAFELLRTTSQDLNVKLRDVAEHVTETGQLP